MFLSAVCRDFIETNKVLFVFRNSVGFAHGEAPLAIASIVVILHGASAVVRKEVVFLVVA